MRDRILFYAIIASVIAHLGVVAVVGHTYASHLSAAPALAHPKFINVDLIDQSKSAQSKPLQAPKVSAPKPVVVPPPPPSLRHPDPLVGGRSTPDSRVAPAKVGGRSTPDTRTVPGNPGGKLNMGSPSAHGDINMGSNGHTPTGWVPNNNTESTGTGSGNGAGVGTPDPPKVADPGPGTRPAPAPVAPPPPKMVSVEVCSESGMLAGKWCQKKHSKEFVEGTQPTRTCDQCKEPFKSTLADRAEPVLERDSWVNLPSSVDEGLSVSVTISYTVNADGDVIGVEVTKSSGNRSIDRAVTSAASKMKYKPAVQGGTPRSVRKTRTYMINT